MRGTRPCKTAIKGVLLFHDHPQTMPLHSEATEEEEARALVVAWACRGWIQLFAC